MLGISTLISKGNSKCPNWGEDVFQGTGWTTVRMLWTFLIVILCVFSCWNLLQFDNDIMVQQCPGKELWFPTSYYYNKDHQWEEFNQCSEELGSDVSNPTAEIGLSWAWRVICVGLFATWSYLQIVSKMDIPEGNYGNKCERIFFTLFKILLILYMHLLFTVNVKNEEALAITTTGFDVATIVLSVIFIYFILKAEFCHQSDVSCFKCSFVWFCAILMFSVVAFQVVRVGTWIVFTDTMNIMYWPNEMICMDLLLLFLFVKIDPELKRTNERTCFSTCGQCWCASSYIAWSLLFLFAIPYFFYNSFCGDHMANIDYKGSCFDTLNYSVQDCDYLLPSTVINSTNNAIDKGEIINFEGTTECSEDLTTYQNIQTLYLPFSDFFWNVDPYYGAVSRVVMFAVIHLVGLLYYLVDHHQLFLDACKVCVYRSYRKQKVLVRSETYVHPKVHEFMAGNSGVFTFWFVIATFLSNSLFLMETTEDESAIILPFTDFILVSVWFVCILYLFACFQCGPRCKFMTDVLLFVVFCGQILAPFVYFGAHYFYQLLKRGFLLNNVLCINFFFAAFDQIRLTYYNSEAYKKQLPEGHEQGIELETSKVKPENAEEEVKRIPGQKSSTTIEVSSSTENTLLEDEEGLTDECSESSLEIHDNRRHPHSTLQGPTGAEGTSGDGEEEFAADDRISE